MMLTDTLNPIPCLDHATVRKVRCLPCIVGVRNALTRRRVALPFSQPCRVQRTDEVFSLPFISAREDAGRQERGQQVSAMTCLRSSCRVCISFWSIQLRSDGIRELGTVGHTHTFRMWISISCVQSVRDGRRWGTFIRFTRSNRSTLTTGNIHPQIYDNYGQLDSLLRSRSECDALPTTAFARSLAWPGSIAGHVHLFDHGRLRRSITRQRVRRHPDQRGPYSKLAHERDEGTWS